MGAEYKCKFTFHVFINLKNVKTHVSFPSTSQVGSTLSSIKKKTHQLKVEKYQLKVVVYRFMTLSTFCLW